MQSSTPKKKKRGIGKKKKSLSLQFFVFVMAGASQSFCSIGDAETTGALLVLQMSEPFGNCHLTSVSYQATKIRRAEHSLEEVPHQPLRGGSGSGCFNLQVLRRMATMEDEA